MKRAVLYARHASDCESQLADLREHCRANDIEVVGEYTDDPEQ